MEDWKEYRLGDLLKIKYGKDHKKLGDGNIPVYGSGGVMRTGDSYLSNKPSVLIPRKGTLSNIFYVEEPFWTVDTMFWSEINDNYVLPKFLYYAIKDYKWDRMNVGSAVPSLTVPVIESVSVSIPSLETQKKIVTQLSELDEKITINRRICENLEAQAQSLFKHWFIDFAPFKNGKFVESELGMIPEGWRIVTLNEACIKVTDGSHYSPKDDPLGNIPMLSVKDMQHNGFDYSSCKKISEEEYEKMKANDCVPLKNDILVAKDGSYLKEIFLCFEEIKQAILSSIAIFRSNNTIIYPEILLQILRLPKIRKDVGDNYVSGTALPRIVLKDFKKYRFVIAPIEVQDKIIGTFREMNALIYKKEQESSRLAQLRDTLLPKLMSGQIKVNEIEKSNI